MRNRRREKIAANKREETSMSKLIRVSFFALSMLGVAAIFAPASAEAGKERCKVYVDGEYRLVARTFTDGGCAAKARDLVGPSKCASGSKKFEYKYMFDGKISERESFCSNLR
jgi:hypothetical protein